MIYEFLDKTGMTRFWANIKSYIDTKASTKQDTLTFDSTPTSSSTNPVTSSGIYSNTITAITSSQSSSGTITNSTGDSYNYYTPYISYTKAGSNTTVNTLRYCNGDTATFDISSGGYNTKTIYFTTDHTSSGTNIFKTTPAFSVNIVGDNTVAAFGNLSCCVIEQTTQYAKVRIHNNSGAQRTLSLQWSASGFPN